MSSFDTRYNLSPKEFAKLVGVSASTVRRWEEEGVIKSVRTESGYRRFAFHDVAKAKLNKVAVSEEKKQKSHDVIIHRLETQKRHHLTVSALTGALFHGKRVTLGFLVTGIFLLLFLGNLAWMREETPSEDVQSISSSVEQDRPIPISERLLDTVSNVLSAETNRAARSIISNIGWNFRSQVQILDLQVNETLTVGG